VRAEWTIPKRTDPLLKKKIEEPLTKKTNVTRRRSLAKKEAHGSGSLTRTSDKLSSGIFAGVLTQNKWITEKEIRFANRQKRACGLKGEDRWEGEESGLLAKKKEQEGGG